MSRRGAESVVFDDDWQANKTVTERNLFMLENEIRTDVTFSVYNNSYGDLDEPAVTIRAHKYMLYAASPVFAAMFSEKFIQPDVIEITDVDPPAFQEMLRFIYTDNAQISYEYVLPIMYAAKKYCIPSLIKDCQQFLETKLSASNACIVYERCTHLGEDALARKCLQFVSEDTASAFDSESFLEVSLSTLEAFLSLDELSIPERDVFSFCLKWATAKLTRNDEICNGAGYRRVLGPALFKIRFPTLTMEDIANDVSMSKVLTEKEELDLYRYLAASEKPVKANLGFPTTPRISSKQSKEYFLTNPPTKYISYHGCFKNESTSRVSFLLPKQEGTIESFLVILPKTDGALEAPNFQLTTVNLTLDLQGFSAPGLPALGWHNSPKQLFGKTFTVCVNSSNTEVRSLSADLCGCIGIIPIGCEIPCEVHTMMITTHFSFSNRKGRRIRVANELLCSTPQYFLLNGLGQKIVMQEAHTEQQNMNFPFRMIPQDSTYPLHLVGIRFGSQLKQ